MNSPTTCEHNRFTANLVVARLTDRPGRFHADVRIVCAECGTAMKFLGLPAGVDLNGAATSRGATEARLAIVPSNGIVVDPVACEASGFTVRDSPVRCPPACRHLRLTVESSIERFGDGDALGPDYSLSVRVVCADCGRPIHRYVRSPRGKFV